jgi:hypothetical protein
MNTLRVLIILFALGWSCLAQALEFLPDPTRPAVTWITLGTGAAAGSAVASDLESTTESENGLQAVIISPHYRAAIINGNQVEMGGKVGSAKLVEINEHGVVLQSEKGRQVMELFSRVNITKHEVHEPVEEAKAAPDNKKVDQHLNAQQNLPKDEGVSK